MEEFRKLLNIIQPQKTITLQDAILISSASTIQEVDSLTELPAYMLNKIMMLDCNSRYLPKSILASERHSTKVYEFLKCGSQNTSQNPVNPMDIFLYLFIQSHPIFRQTLVTQVSKCQLSLPLIISYPSAREPTLYLFALKTLHKDIIGSDYSSTSFSVTEEKLPIISFIRIGDCGKSQKSEILNRIIGISDYFSNRNQLGNSKKRYFLDGTVEIAWWFPNTQLNNQLPCVILNLRGDAFAYPKLCEFLSTISTFLYVFVPMHRCDQTMSYKLTELEKKITSKAKFLLYNERTSIEGLCNPEFMEDNVESCLVLEKNNLGDDCELISECMYSLLKRNDIVKMSLNDCLSIARSSSIKIDIDEFNIFNCESLAESIVSRMLQPLDHDSNTKSKPLAMVKKHMFPLQGEPLSEWSKATRELHNSEMLEYNNINDSQELHKQKIIEARQNQVEMLRNPSPLLKDIFNHCKSYGQSGGEFFILWKLLQNDFNSLSKIHLPPLYEEYRKLYKLKLETNSKSNEEVDTYQINLREAAKNITQSSLGIEHVFRELGQVFEAYQSSRNKQKQYLERTFDFRIRTLDDIFASLIVEGHAFEILDGDVNHVPVEWVTSVLQSLALKIGSEKRIFVLSVLGSQSTGKSTLLNAMFGANFPVSSGRCTRGIFMQLIPIAENLRSQLRYDYLVLLDTEGLRAPELSNNFSYKRDNELATFVVGLGDATIINLYGEGHSDVQDILQIIVFAFIRMKETYSKPRCMFVHQNVPDTHAHTNLLTARSNLMKNLDKMTECAAHQENKVGLYKQFCDVMEFHPEEEVFYFPGLFEGEPPLNKISNVYAKNAAGLRAHILNCFRNDKKKFNTITEWSNKLNSLWKAVLQEDFVFSYRNALEVTARFELDHKLSSWISKYIQAMTLWKSESVNLLFNADIEILEETWGAINSELTKECINPSIECESQEKLMNLFFREHENVEIMAQWEESIRLHLEKRRETLINELEREYKMIYQLQQTKKEMDQKFTRCRKDIIIKVKTLFNEMKDQGKSLDDESLIEFNFEKIWKEWKSQIEVDEIKRCDISVDLRKAFSESQIIKSMKVLSGKSQLLTNISKFLEIGEKNFENLTNFFPSHNPEYFVWKNITKKSTLTVLFSAIFNANSKPDHGTNRFKSELRIIETECERTVKEFMSPLLKNLSPYDPNSFLIIIQEIYKIISKHNASLQNMNNQESIQLTTEFIFDYIFYQSCKAIPILEKIQENFISRTSLDFKFEQLQQQLNETFTGLCTGIQNEYSCALALANIIFEAMREYLADLIPEFALCVFLEDPKHSITYQSRASLILTILKDLAYKRSFEDYISYIYDPFNYMIIYTQKQLKSYFEESARDVISKRFFEKVNSLVEFYFTESLNSCFCLNESSDPNKWNSFKNKFYSAIKHKVRNLSSSDFDVLDIHTIENYEQFCNFFSEVMKFKIDQTDWNSWIDTILQGESLYKRLINPLMECTALCPFCNEPCQLSIGDHEHYCGTFHRPKGVQGWHRHGTHEISLNDCTVGLKYKRNFGYNGKFYEYINYKTVNANFKSWKILGDDALDSKYWQWVLYTFEENFVKYHNNTKNKDISKWKDLSVEEVLKDLEKHYSIYIFNKN